MIRFSRKEDYAVILVHALAKEYNKRLLPLSEVARNYKISLLFLRNLARALRGANIISATEGKNGGYFLTKAPDEILMGDIFSALTTKPMLLCCETGVKNGTCEKISFCEVGSIWRRLNKEFLHKISSMSVEQFSKYEQNV
jgi:Rrf2 family protein